MIENTVDWLQILYSIYHNLVVFKSWEPKIISGKLEEKVSLLEVKKKMLFNF